MQLSYHWCGPAFSNGSLWFLDDRLTSTWLNHGNRWLLYISSSNSSRQRWDVLLSHSSSSQENVDEISVAATRARICIMYIYIYFFVLQLYVLLLLSSIIEKKHQHRNYNSRPGSHSIRLDVYKTLNRTLYVKTPLS